MTLPRLSMATIGFPNCGGKIEGRHISIIALSGYHVDYMNRKGWYSFIMQGNLFTDLMCTSDSLDTFMAPGFWQTLIFIAGVRKKYCSEIESCKSKPMDQKFQLFCVVVGARRRLCGRGMKKRREFFLKIYFNQFPKVLNILICIKYCT